MALRDRLRRLQKAARGEMDWLDLRDGSRFYFEPMEAHKELFLEMLRALHTEFEVPDLSDGPHELEDPAPAPEQDVSELRAALSKATPDSLRRFEERYRLEVYEDLGVVHDDGSTEYARFGPLGAEQLGGDEEDG